MHLSALTDSVFTRHLTFSFDYERRAHKPRLVFPNSLNRLHSPPIATVDGVVERIG